MGFFSYSRTTGCIHHLNCCHSEQARAQLVRVDLSRRAVEEPRQSRSHHPARRHSRENMPLEFSCFSSSLGFGFCFWSLAFQFWFVFLSLCLCFLRASVLKGFV